MARGQKLLRFLIFQLVLVLLVLDHANAQGLTFDYYAKTCPNAESIVYKTAYGFISRAPTLAPPLLRMQFHDCFVTGCDASVLLNSTKTNQAEKDAFPNLTLRGFEVIDAVKAAVEEACPGVVSCADIIALVARDVVSMINGPYWEVPLGRRDGTVSLASEVLAELPGPFNNITTLRQLFAAKGLNTKEIAVLSGAHTIGVSHCFSFSNRLYNFTGKGGSDPSMDPNYIATLKQECKPGDTTTVVEMDPGSFENFDNHYYTLVSQRRGLFQSDAALLTDPQTKAYVLSQAPFHEYSTSPTFAKDFGEAMVKMGKALVLTGMQGEIRKNCAFVN